MAGNSHFLDNQETIRAKQLVERARKSYKNIKQNLLPWFKTTDASDSDKDAVQWQLDITDELERLGIFSRVLEARPFGNIDSLRSSADRLGEVEHFLTQWKQHPATAPWVKNPKAPPFFPPRNRSHAPAASFKRLTLAD